MTNLTEPFIDALLGQMTLNEKIGQLNQYNGGDRLDTDLIRQGKAGSLLNADGPLTGQGQSDSGSAEQRNYYQRIALESRLKIPLIFGRDVIHGYRTVFPIPLGQAAAFNPDLTEQAAAVAAKEASADGFKWAFSPMIDIARDPRWGRVAEGSGEDPYLASMLAASAVRGMQGDDMAQPDRIVACAKHFVGYGAAEGGRDYEGGEISEPTLRDIYLPPYESAVKAGVGTIMSAFIDLNGIPATAERRLLTGVLRDEWGFEGFVVSDWASVAELVQHGVAEDRARAAAIALHAGVDMDMVSEAYLETLAAGVRAGSVPVEEIDEAVRRILRIKQRAGLFDQPFTEPARYTTEVLTPESRQIARQFARESMVLLKNRNDILPLHGFRRIMVTGNYVHARGEMFGTWSPDGSAVNVTPLDQALKEAAPKDAELWFVSETDAAISAAQHVDAVVIVLGEHPSRSGENANVSSLTLPPGQAELVDAMANTGKPVVLVVFAGRPLAITHQVSQVDAVLYAWHPGIEGGPALGDILFGAYSPSGRLPITFPRATGQVPIYYNHKNSGRPIDSEQGFHSRYIDVPSSPLFPFGFGLGYTTFRYANLTLSSQALRGSVEVYAEVTNTGGRAGKELVQLYVRDLVGSLTRPVRELKGFQQVEIQPGETRCVSFIINEEMLAFTRGDGTKGIEPGRFHVWIAPDSSSGLRGEFEI